MGNSLQDVITFGRRAGMSAAAYVKGGVEVKDLTLAHVTRFEKELAEAGIQSPMVAPILLPDYTTDDVASRRLMEARLEAE
jgi:succinate dehydrogenase/fumarate reductase flavoprotein subunit